MNLCGSVVESSSGKREVQGKTPTGPDFFTFSLMCSIEFASALKIIFKYIILISLGVNLVCFVSIYSRSLESSCTDIEYILIVLHVVHCSKGMTDFKIVVQ